LLEYLLSAIVELGLRDGL